jgi:thimet oligopeptidase
MNDRLSKLGRLTSALALGALAMVASAQEVPSEVKAAIVRADEAVAKIIAIPSGQRTFDNTVGALDDLVSRLDSETGLALFMQYVSSSEKERADSRAAEEAYTAWSIALGKNEELYKAVKAYADTKPKLEGEQERLLAFTLRDYRRAGMDLSVAQRNRLKEIELELQKLATDFQKNIYEDETVILLTEAETKGLPADTKASLKRAGSMYILSMDGPTFNAAMDYMVDEDARQRAWYAYKRRGGQRNVRLLEKILGLRAEMATTLGYRNTVDYEIETRMAKNSETVAKFYRELQPIVRQKAKQDYDLFLAEKRKFTRDRNAKLYPWDYSFYKKQLLKTKYAVDSQKVAEYFPVTQVFDGLFQITSSIYGIEFKDVTADTEKLGLPKWHEDAKLWAVSDKGSGELLGHIYTDLFPRENKYNHAAC